MDGKQPAFPIQRERIMKHPLGESKILELFDGFTKREVFAAVALQGLLAYGGKGYDKDGDETYIPHEEIAEQAVFHADNLIKELSK